MGEDAVCIAIVFAIVMGSCAAFALNIWRARTVAQHTIAALREDPRVSNIKRAGWREVALVFRGSLVFLTWKGPRLICACSWGGPAYLSGTVVSRNAEDAVFDTAPALDQTRKTGDRLFDATFSLPRASSAQWIHNLDARARTALCSIHGSTQGAIRLDSKRLTVETHNGLGLRPQDISDLLDACVDVLDAIQDTERQALLREESPATQAAHAAQSARIATK